MREERRRVAHCALAMRMLGMLVLAMCGCGESPTAPKPPQTPPKLETSAEPTATVAEAPERQRVFGRTWVRFNVADASDIPFWTRRPRGPDGHPRWVFETPSLPAISADGKRLLVPHVDSFMGAGPNLEIREIDIDTGADEPFAMVLEGAAFSLRVGAVGDASKVARNMGARVRDRVIALNEKITAQAWRPLMGSCAIESTPSDGLSPCGAQTISCKDWTLHHTPSNGEVRVTGVHGERASLSWKSTPPTPLGNQPTPTVAACATNVLLDERMELLVARLEGRCINTGDWCDLPMKWHVERTAQFHPHEAMDALPAISTDGKQVAVWAFGDDGARGNPKSAVIVFDTRTGNAVGTHPIHVPTEYDSLGEKERKTREVDRIQKVEARLGKSTWRKLTALPMKTDPAVPSRFQGLGNTNPLMAESAELHVRFAEPRLTITNKGKTVVRRDFPTWSATGYAHCNAALADLQAVWVDSTTRFALIAIAFGGGTDLCWEPESEFHIVRY